MSFIGFYRVFLQHCFQCCKKPVGWFGLLMGRQIFRYLLRFGLSIVLQEFYFLPFCMLL